ncbi:calcyclin-binding protein-like [Phoenix dactylifera]|uniref:Calcyclin-binding protein n=1 Tax=Phoenix dactylifera TaxID=42345 RepID=A0A8B7D278_PHODC|nr:calcyclin-binding protein-like [Phoenix dactylifera]
MAEEQQLRLDLEELRHLESIAKRPRVLSILSSEIRNLDTKLSKVTAAVAAAAAAAQPAVSAEKAPAAASALNYVTLGSFSWDQDNDKIKLYVFLEGVQEERMETVFKRMLVDIKFHDVQGKNYRFSIPKLNKEIVPEKCKVVVKPTKVVVTLSKASKGNWLDLHFKDDKLKPGVDKDKDPMAGIMDLMKNMYEEGDDEMKRTIAKAWSDARSGKTADPLKGFP